MRRLEDRLADLASTGRCLHRTWARNPPAIELSVPVEPRPDVLRMVLPQPDPILAAIGPLTTATVRLLMQNLEETRLAGRHNVSKGARDLLSLLPIVPHPMRRHVSRTL